MSQYGEALSPIQNNRGSRATKKGRLRTVRRTTATARATGTNPTQVAKKPLFLSFFLVGPIKKFQKKALFSFDFHVRADRLLKVPNGMLLFCREARRRCEHGTGHNVCCSISGFRTNVSSDPHELRHSVVCGTE